MKVAAVVHRTNRFWEGHEFHSCRNRRQTEGGFQPLGECQTANNFFGRLLGKTKDFSGRSRNHESPIDEFNFFAVRKCGPREDSVMRPTIATTWIAAGALLLLGFSAAPARAQSQAGGDSLADYARSVRKNKPDTGASSRHYDNDNLPRTGTLSVVGPEAPPPNAAKDAGTAQSGAANSDRQKATAELQKKIDEQQKKVDTLTKDLDLQQREFRLRVAQFYTDPNNRLQNSAKWDEENKQYQADSESKQKAIDSARTQLNELQKQAKDAGIEQKTSDKDSPDKDKSDKNDNKDTTKSDNSDKK